ncbi:MAG: hypothetical protein FWD03_09740, partial [Defluviitaleaceae bacterium]|nr:hypothetical protein [Defluviitaleaceae bacterium]
PVRITLTNGNIGPLTDILFSAWNTRSHRTDYMAAAAYISYFLGHTDTLEVRDVRSRLHRNDGIPEVVYEPEEFYYTARFAASFPEFVDRGALIRYIQREMEHTYSSRHAAGLMALAAVGEPVLLQIQDEVASLHDIHPVNYIDYMTAIYLAAALVAIGDDAGAMHLMATLPQPFEGNLSITERETLNTVLLFINTAIHPQVAWDHLNRGSSNVHVSDVAERINFVRRAAVLGETISEVQYYLNGTTHTVRLEHFDRVSLHISHEQFEALNLTPISGATDFHIDFYGYDATNWDADGNRIGIRRSIVRDGDLFRVDIQVTIPPDATGFYTIHDRLPSNLRFLPMRRLNDWERDWFNHFWITNPQRQLVEIRFWADRDRLDRTFSYHALELFEADMAPGTAYISNGDAEDHVWGRTE